MPLYPPLILKRETYLSGNSKEENQRNLTSEQFRRQSRMSFFRNEKLAERISRDQSLKKVKPTQDSDHLGILSVMDDKQRKPVQKNQIASKEKLGTN